MPGAGGGERTPPPEGRKNFRKFVEIGNVKFNNFTKIASIILHGVGQKYKNN